MPSVTDADDDLLPGVTALRVVDSPLVNAGFHGNRVLVHVGTEDRTPRFHAQSGPYTEARGHSARRHQSVPEGGDAPGRAERRVRLGPYLLGPDNGHAFHGRGTGRPPFPIGQPLKLGRIHTKTQRHSGQKPGRLRTRHRDRRRGLGDVFQLGQTRR